MAARLQIGATCCYDAAKLRASDLQSCAGLPEHVTHYVYDGTDLNRVAYEDIIEGLQAITDIDIVKVCHSVNQKFIIANLYHYYQPRSTTGFSAQDWLLA